MSDKPPLPKPTPVNDLQYVPNWGGAAEKFPRPFHTYGLNQPCVPNLWFESYAGTPIDSQDVIVAAIEGYRVWWVNAEPERLRSLVFVDTIWEPYQALEARCHGVGYCNHRCDAGIYAYNSVEKLFAEFINSYHQDSRVFGTVNLWGKIICCQDGYRAQFAYPAGFYDVTPRAAVLAKAYGVPLIPNSFPSRVPPDCV